MQTITVNRLDENTFEVIVAAPPSTTHLVTVRPDYAARLTGGKVSVETLVKESFVFLLEREPNTSILRRFDLAEISRYFPEYERTILSSAG
jgi:hypothetical protein